MKRSPITLAMVMLSLPGVSFATDFTWNGSVSSYWVESANWTPTGVPGPGDSVTVPSGRKSIELTDAREVARFTLDGGFVAGSGTLTANTAFVWTAGTLSGTGRLVIPAGAALTLSGANGKNLVGWTIEVAGTARWEGTGDIRGGEGAILQIQSTGAFEISSDQSIYQAFSGGPPLLNNAGTVRKTGGTGTTTLSSVPLNNDGRLEIQTGTLSVTGRGTSGGSYSVAAGATLDFGGGTHELKPASSISGNGNVVVRGGTVTVNGSFAVTGRTTISGGTLNLMSDAYSGGEVHLSTGTLTGTGALTHAGTFTWDGGTLSGAGALIIPNGATMLVSGTSTKVLLTKALRIAGVARWESAGSVSSGQGATVQLDPGSVFEIWEDSSFLYGMGGTTPIISNSGTIRKTAGTGYFSFGGVDFRNTGILQADVGAISVSGTLAQEDALLRFSLRSPSDFGRFEVTGTAPLNGTLEADLKAGFQPTVGDSFPLISYTSRSGSFINWFLPVLTNGLVWRADYLRDRLQIVAFAPKGLDRKITGTVRSTSGMPIQGAGVLAFKLDSTNVLSAGAMTDDDGEYTLSVSNGTWQVGLRGLAALGFQSVPSQTATIAGADTVLDFVVPPLGGETFILTVQANPADGGVVTGGGSYSSGTEVTVTATPNRMPVPYVFVTGLKMESSRTETLPIPST